MADDVNVCGACHLDFSSVESFDKHRVGRHGHTLAEGLRQVPPVEDGRRCLVAHELRDRGFAQDARGRWGEVSRRVRAFGGVTVDPPSVRRAA